MKKENKPQRAVIYTRVSTRETSHRKNSIKEQKKYLGQFAEKNGLAVVR